MVQYESDVGIQKPFWCKCIVGNLLRSCNSGPLADLHLLLSLLYSRGLIGEVRCLRLGCWWHPACWLPSLKADGGLHSCCSQCFLAGFRLSCLVSPEGSREDMEFMATAELGAALLPQSWAGTFFAS